MTFKPLEKSGHFILLGLGLLLITFFAVWQGWFSGMQNRVQNNFYDQDSASQEIIIVSIDEASLNLQNLGPLTQWKRAYYAQAIENLYEEGAAVVGIDITFPDPSPHGPEDDEILRNTLESYPNTVLALHYYFENEVGKVEWPNRSLLNLPLHQLGNINVQLDEDGFIRKLPLFTQTPRGVVEAFALAVSRSYLNQAPVGYAISNEAFAFSQETRIPVISQQDGEQTVHSMYINYFSKPYGYRHISFVNVIEGNNLDKQDNPIDFKDKIVLIGPTAIDLQDHYLSPVSEGVRMPGVEIHANAVQTIVEGKFLRDLSSGVFWFLLILIVIVNVSLFSFLKVRYALPIVLAEGIGFLVAGVLAYEGQVLMNVIYPILLVLASFVGTYVLRFYLEQKKRKFIEGAFGHYVNKSIVKQIQQNPEMLALGGIKREITIFFSDIANFTGISEQMTPTELVSFLNEYLHEMTEIVLNHNGTLDKYEGDSIMAFWNAPVAQHDPALHACLAALENQEKLSQLRKKWAKEGKPEIRIRIGLNTGPAVVGNMGSKQRFDYTAMGDNVNLGSRLEGVNKFYGSEILMSEATYNEVSEHLIARELDLIRVKGRHEPVRIYELQGKKGELNEEQLLHNESFARALNLYRAKNFSEAKLRFQDLATDPVAKVFVARCDHFIQTPPAQNWDGVWNFEQK